MTFEQVPEPVVMGGWVSEIAQKLKDRLDEALEQAYENGFLTLGAAKPQERWEFFKAHTLPHDYEWLLMDDYLEQRKTGAVPILEAERIANEYRVKVQQAAASGMPTPPENPYLYPWPVALSEGTSAKVFELLRKDFANLLRAEMRRQQRESVQSFDLSPMDAQRGGGYATAFLG